MKRRLCIAVAFGVLAIALLFCSIKRAEANPLSGDYFGTAAIDSPAGLGNIDLAFRLTLDGSGNIIVDSYILLDKTVLFPVVAPQVNSVDVGPRVTGQVTAAQFSLTTQSFSTKLFAGSASEKVVTHQIALNSTTIAEGGNSITGTYTETLTGYFADPTLVTGTFVLVRPVAVTTGYPVCQDSMAPFGVLTIEEIRAGGKDPGVVEFEDITAAMRYYRGLASGLTVSKATMEQAILEYHQYVNGQQ